MPFTDDEKAKIRHHLGYLNAAEVASFVLGTPAALDSTFLLESAMNRVLPSAEPLVRRYLCRLEETECQRFSSQKNLAASQIGDITTGGKAEQDQLAENYQYWQQSLANILGVAPNAFDKRDALAPGGINVRVLG